MARAVIAQRLPPEIVDNIADGNRGDRRSLAASSLVCKSWLQSNRYHLFSEFDVYVGPNVGASFLKLLHHPLCTFVYCIRSISIYPGSPDALGVAGLGDGTVTALANLKHVTSLRIHNHRGFISKPVLTLLTSAFGEVTSLRLRNSFPSFHDAIEFFTAFPALKTLDFDSWCVGASPAAVPDTLPPPATLSAIQLHSPFKDMSWFLDHHHRFPSLTLSEIADKNFPVVDHTLKTFGPDLHTLSLRFKEREISASPPSRFCQLDFLSNTRLTFLELEVPDGDLSVVFLFLQNLRLPTVQVLRWNFGRANRLYVLYGAVPSEADARLADRQSFKCLGQLEFMTRYGIEGASHSLSLLQQKSYPKAAAVGIAIIHRYV
ncbi:hypothetical protein R3P38DRAFT_3048470 [Favolaschia claudopus]|uniref:F-box domain-containing protein n=1 Tax=Favolaschia claudopus TaxID=2862362 RepID=A0AAW0A585_9AGAR